MLLARNRILRCGVHGHAAADDAAAITFPDNTFDIVYAPYLISVVPIPSRWRRRWSASAAWADTSCSTTSQLDRLVSLVERAITPFTVHIGFKSDSICRALTQAHLQPDSIEKVNIPRIWSLVTIVKR
jgi:hypothetical protein